MKKSERLEFGLQKIDQDLALCRNLFVEVLQQTGHQEVVANLPWSNSPEKRKSLSHQDIQAYTILFQILNQVEENAANQTRRWNESQFGLSSEKGLWAGVFQSFLEEGWSPEDLRPLLSQVRVEPVLTAHPTEAKRITVMEQHRELYILLVERENQMFSPAEREWQEEQIKSVLERLWRTGEILLEKPSIASERNSQIHYLKKVFPTALDQVDQHFRSAWKAVGWPLEALPDPWERPQLQFGTWVGGDRDGHPLVTPGITRETLQLLRHEALKLLHHSLENLGGKLSLSGLLQQPGPAFRENLLTKLAEVGSHAEKITARNPNEPWRQFVACLLHKLPRPNGENTPTPAQCEHYNSPQLLLEDLRLLRQSLLEQKAQRIVAVDLDPVIRRVQTFGFHLARLDLRQNSSFHDRAIGQVLAAAGFAETNFIDWPEEKKVAFFEEQLNTAEPLLHGGSEPGPEASAAIGALREFTRYWQKFGPRGLGYLILSMTRSPADLLGVYFLAREAGLLQRTDQGVICLLPVVPLLETLQDLENGPEILEAFLAHPITRNSLARRATLAQKENPPAREEPFCWPTQPVMLGYSDSNKDSGILASQWGLQEAQRKLIATAQKQKYRLTFFHGRGGTVSRGAGPTDRFLAALPAGTLQGNLRLTEQGETIGQKYANRFTAGHQLDLLLAGTLRQTVRTAKSASPDQVPTELIAKMAKASAQKYQDLKTQEGFLTFYSQATPLDVLENSRIGSRPSRRTGTRSLDDLRAIPWVFSWSQARFFLPGWYGLGSALASLTTGEKESLTETLPQSAFLRYVMNNIELALRGVEWDIVQEYGALVTDGGLREKFLGNIEKEYQLSIAAIEQLFPDQWKERRPRLAKTLLPRAEALRPLHRRQIELLTQWREEGSDSQSPLLDDLLLTVNAIAAGLRTTG